MTLQRAVRELREAGERIYEAKAEQQQIINELHCQVPEVLQDAIEDANINRILETLEEVEDAPKINANDVDPEVPKTWNEAQKSHNVGK